LEKESFHEELHGTHDLHESEQRNGPEIAFHLRTPSPNKLILKINLFKLLLKL